VPNSTASWATAKSSTREEQPRLGLRELWAYRDLALILALRELQLRYRQTLLGVAWIVLQPLAAMLIFALVFGRSRSYPATACPTPRLRWPA
jgi:ABC-type polysaccharide/polyol phosphate export permease